MNAHEIEMPTPDEAAANPERRDKYEAWKKAFDEVKGKAEVQVAKQRHGSTGVVRLAFDARVTKFSDVAEEDYFPAVR